MEYGQCGTMLPEGQCQRAAGHHGPHWATAKRPKGMRRKDPIPPRRSAR